MQSIQRMKIYQHLIFSSLLLLSSQTWAQDEQNVSEKEKNNPLHNHITPAQQLVASTGEEMLNMGNAGHAQTMISGYGDFAITHDFAYANTSGKLNRAVLFVGHQFNSKIAFFSELEVANGRVEGGALHGEVGMEQAYLKYSLNPRQYFLAGLINPRIGIANEMHLPVNFNGTSVPFVEQFIIPSTWSELGLAFYGQLSSFPIQYTIAVTNGLNASKFEHGSGFRSGVQAGQDVSFNSLATTASLRGYWGDFEVQVSGYYGGTVSQNPYVADSMGIASGIFANPLMLGEMNVQYNRDAFSAKALGVFVSHPQAAATNTNFANNTPAAMFGFYGELAYDFFFNSNSKKLINQSLVGFLRYEKLDMNYKLPQNGIEDGTLNQSHWLAGLSYFPTPNVAIKADLRYTQTGPFNPYTVVNPPPLLRPYAEQNVFLSLGVGYSF